MSSLSRYALGDLSNKHAPSPPASSKKQTRNENHPLSPERSFLATRRRAMKHSGTFSAAPSPPPSLITSTALKTTNPNISRILKSHNQLLSPPASQIPAMLKKKKKNAGALDTVMTVKKVKGKVGMNSGPKVALEVGESSDHTFVDGSDSEEENEKVEVTGFKKGLFERLERIENELDVEIDDDDNNSNCNEDLLDEVSEVTFKQTPGRKSPTNSATVGGDVCPPSQEMRQYAYSLLSPAPSVKSGGKTPSCVTTTSPILSSPPAALAPCSTPTPAKLALDGDSVEMSSPSSGGGSPIGSGEVVKILREGVDEQKDEDKKENRGPKDGNDGSSSGLFLNAGVVAGVSALLYYFMRG